MKFSIGIDIYKLFVIELELNVRDVICKFRIFRISSLLNFYNEIFFKMGKCFIVFWFIKFENRIIIICNNIYKVKKIYN